MKNFLVKISKYQGASHICKKTLLPIPNSPFPIPKKRQILGFLQNWDAPKYHLSLASSIALATITSNYPSLAQIIPDATLPNNSIVTPNGNTIRIDGGTRNGGLIAAPTLGRAAAGALILTASELVVDSSLVATVTVGSGAGDSIAVDADKLTATNGGLLSATTFGSGEAGDLTVRVSGPVELRGFAVGVGEQLSGLVASSQPGTRGAAGSIALTAGELRMSDIPHSQFSNSPISRSDRLDTPPRRRHRIGGESWRCW